MKLVLFLFLLLPLFTFSQKKHLADYMGLTADSSARSVSLPDLRRTDFYNIPEIRKDSSNNYVISNDSTYYKLFRQYPKDSLPVFDFTRQELIVYFVCIYCGRSFNNPANPLFDNAPSHRNAHSYAEYWFVQDRRKPGY